MSLNSEFFRVFTSVRIGMVFSRPRPIDSETIVGRSRSEFSGDFGIFFVCRGFGIRYISNHQKFLEGYEQYSSNFVNIKLRKAISEARILLLSENVIVIEGLSQFWCLSLI